MRFVMVIERWLISMKSVLLLIFLSVLFISCVSIKSIIVSSSTLDGKTFILTNMYDDIKITISFENESFFGFSGINTYFGNYEVRRGNMLILKNIGMTQMSGPPNIMDIESQYMDYLNEASYIALKGDTLRIDTIDGKYLIFKRIKK